MKLARKDADHFFKLYLSLLAYINRKFNKVEGLTSPDDFISVTRDQQFEIKEALYQHPELISSYISENPDRFSADELDIVSGWVNFVQGKFLIFHYLKNYTIFLDTGKPPIAYGVLALYDDFQSMIRYPLPVMVEAVLLPFCGGIITDGLISLFRITFGGSLRQDFHEAYQEARSRFGIITTLPFTAKSLEQSDEEKLKLYLKNEHNRELYWNEIVYLSGKSPELLRLFHQEMGRINARAYSKRLRDIGIDQGWFAIIEGIIVAGGTTRNEVERVVRDLVPEGKRAFVYIYQFKN